MRRQGLRPERRINYKFRTLDWRLNVSNSYTFVMGILEFLHVSSELFVELLDKAENTLRLLTVNHVASANYFPSVLASFALQKAIEVSKLKPD